MTEQLKKEGEAVHHVLHVFRLFAIRMGTRQQAEAAGSRGDPWTKALRTRLCSGQTLLVAGWPGLCTCPQSVELASSPATHAQD